MSLIEASYFRSSINIPNVDRAEIAEQLDWFIKEYEQELLIKLFGLPLYNDFIAGIAQSSPLQKWIDILYGKQYTIGGLMYKWRGLIVYDPQSPAVSLSIAPSAIEFVIGRGNILDPVAGSSVYTNPILTGKNYVVFERGIGPLRTDEIIKGSISFTLASGTFNDGDSYFLLPLPGYNFSTPLPNASFKLSIIAYYIYYNYVRNLATQSTGVGEVVGKAENAQVVSPAQKMCDAWNKLVYWAYELFDFMNYNRDVYPTWMFPYYGRNYGNEFHTINVLNI